MNAQNDLHHPRRVLMTADTLGGVWNYALELIRGFQPYGIEVGLATMGARLSPSQYDEIAGLANATLFESEYKLEWMESPWDDVARAGSWLLALEKDFNADLVHLNNYAHGCLPWHVPSLIVAHSCVVSWWRAVRQTSLPPRLSRYREEVQRGLRAVNSVIAPTHAMLTSLGRDYGELRRCKVIRNGRRLELPLDRTKQPLILSAGRFWDEAKNIAALEEAAKELPWPIYVAGESQHPDGGEVNLPRIRMLGNLEQKALASWMMRASIFALPARYEPFGLSVLEAGLAGCALVLGDIESLRENWDGAAEFVPPGEPEQLRECLEMLVHDPERRQRLGHLAQCRAREFTPGRMIASYLTTYGKLLSEGSLGKDQRIACAS